MNRLERIESTYNPLALSPCSLSTHHPTSRYHYNPPPLPPPYEQPVSAIKKKKTRPFLRTHTHTHTHTHKRHRPRFRPQPQPLFPSPPLPSPPHKPTTQLEYRSQLPIIPTYPLPRCLQVRKLACFSHSSKLNCLFAPVASFVVCLAIAHVTSSLLLLLCTSSYRECCLGCRSWRSKRGSYKPFLDRIPERLIG